MTILATSKTKKIPGPTIRANCPKCGPNVPVVTFGLEERMGLFFIPLFTQRETYVECPACGSARLTDLTFDELAACPPDEIDRHVFQRISIITKFMALASLAVFCVPFVGLGMGIAGFVATRRTGGWVKVVSLIGIVLGAFGTLGMLTVMLTSKQP